MVIAHHKKAERLWGAVMPKGAGKKAATSKMGAQRSTARDTRLAALRANHMAYRSTGRHSS